MKVLQVTNYFPGLHRHVGGAEQACYRTALLARCRGWEVGLVTTRPDFPAPIDFPYDQAPILEDFLPGVLRPYVEAAKWYALQFDPLARRAFRKVLNREKPEVVHFHNIQFLTLDLITAAKEAGGRTCMSIYDYWLFCPTVMLAAPENGLCRRAPGPGCLPCLPPRLRMIQGALLSLRGPIIERLYDRVDAFQVLSEHSRRVLEGRGIPRSRIHVVPLTLPLEFREDFGPAATPDPNLIFFAGWLNERKGLHRLLEALPGVLKAHPQARLVAAGGRVRFGDDYHRRLEQLLDRGGCRPAVTLTGHLSPAQVRAYLKKAAVVVIPEQYENMGPLLMVEAMALGRPLVISRVGGVPEVVEDGVSGWLADSHNPQDFADKIIRTLSDPRGAKVMGDRARENILARSDEEAIWDLTRKMYEARP